MPPASPQGPQSPNPSPGGPTSLPRPPPHPRLTSSRPPKPLVTPESLGGPPAGASRTLSRLHRPPSADSPFLLVHCPAVTSPGHTGPSPSPLTASGQPPGLSPSLPHPEQTTQLSSDWQGPWGLRGWPQPRSSLIPTMSLGGGTLSSVSPQRSVLLPGTAGSGQPFLPVPTLSRASVAPHCPHPKRCPLPQEWAWPADLCSVSLISLGAGLSKPLARTVARAGPATSGAGPEGAPRGVLRWGHGDTPGTPSQAGSGEPPPVLCPSSGCVWRCWLQP